MPFRHLSPCRQSNRIPGGDPRRLARNDAGWPVAALIFPGGVQSPGCEGQPGRGGRLESSLHTQPLVLPVTPRNCPPLSRRPGASLVPCANFAATICLSRGLLASRSLSIRRPGKLWKAAGAIQSAFSEAMFGGERFRRVQFRLHPSAFVLLRPGPRQGKSGENLPGCRAGSLPRPATACAATLRPTVSIVCRSASQQQESPSFAGGIFGTPPARRSFGKLSFSRSWRRRAGDEVAPCSGAQAFVIRTCDIRVGPPGLRTVLALPQLRIGGVTFQHRGFLPPLDRSVAMWQQSVVLRHSRLAGGRWHQLQLL